MSAAAIAVGVAGWAIPAPYRARFAPQGSHLQRYASRLPAVEINSAFYRPHRRETYERWAASVPAGFRFAVKMPRTVTHDHALERCERLLDAYLGQVAGLGAKLGCILVQLAPGHPFVPRIAQRFIAALRKRHGGAIAWEPRHASWFTPAAEQLLRDAGVARVLADPVLHGADQPGGWSGFTYVRLHGSPRMYWSSYEPAVLRALASRLRLQGRSGTPVYCIFDNTAMGTAVGNALELQALLRPAPGTPEGRRHEG